jgi:hypothetical protein
MLRSIVSAVILTVVTEVYSGPSRAGRFFYW